MTPLYLSINLLLKKLMGVKMTPLYLSIQLKKYEYDSKVDTYIGFNQFQNFKEIFNFKYFACMC